MREQIAYCPEPLSIDELIHQLRSFFTRSRALRLALSPKSPLNRLQRQRCKDNLLNLERLERQFYAIEHSDDYHYLHRRLCRYLYLDSRGLMLTLGHEEIECIDLFIPA